MAEKPGRIHNDNIEGENEMEKNKVKIICNPYSKTIDYRRWGLDSSDGTSKWMELGSKSKIITDKKFTHATIQHNAYEIINEIAEEYNRGNAGLEIVFEGTEEDYIDLSDVVEQFFAESGITCINGDFYIELAEIIMPKIQEVFKNLHTYFKEYGSDEINSIVMKYFDATKPVIPICVVGMYSTGKSAFINALIGDEVLPSAVNPTTARNYKIIESESIGAICFHNEKEKIEIIFEGEKYNITGNIDKELHKKIEKELGDKVESIYSGLYQALCVINTYADQTGKIAEMIEVKVPFCNGVLKSDDYDFVIFDTPGSDSKSHEEHIKVLKNALGEQTNGLPILLTSPKDMDRTGADALLKVVNGIDGNLDLTNAMIIVNQADSVSSKSLEKVKLDANTILTQWKSNRLYFMSAILGLGSKKIDYNDEDSWIDEDYLEIFFKNVDSFCKSDSRLYKQLFKHNQIAKNRYNRYVNSVENEKSERQLIYINSGLHCIEKEIVEFAKKFALYNKCAQAEDYLTAAINYTSEIIVQKEKEEEELREKISGEQKDAKKLLLNKLKEIVQSSSDEFENKYPTVMEETVENLSKSRKETVLKIVKDSWASVQNADKSKKVSLFFDVAKKTYEVLQLNIKETLFEKSKGFCDAKRESLQRACCDLIKEDEELTPEEKKKLEEFVMNLKVVTQKSNITFSTDDISKHVVDLWGLKLFKLNSIDEKKTTNLFISNMEMFIRRINVSTIDLHKEEFEGWNKRLRVGLTKEIGNFNPTLRGYAVRLAGVQDEIEELQNVRRILSENQLEINKMFDLRVRDEEI